MIKNSNISIQELINNIKIILHKNDEKIIDESLNKINQIINEQQVTQKHLFNILLNQIIHNENNIHKFDEIIFHKINLEDNTRNRLKKILPQGIQDFKKYINKNYKTLNELLKVQNFQEADRITSIELCKIVNRRTNSSRNWLYFTDINKIPTYDLFIIDLLWSEYSNGNFGFLTQKRIWQQNDNWLIFLDKIGWLKDGYPKRYPQDFIWNINAPKGHLPLFNQIRGNQTLLNIFKHKTWQEYYES
uniref:GUN4-like domain-containing protein n=1 Tax=Taenioma perpusillum TaxID=210852 RepID=A0A1Z1MRC0_9FLOR|nr:hypothetical protein [Taenioma perpusillum]ARW68419.1 hypothetical protein [Taenioma perpusillum]